MPMLSLFTPPPLGAHPSASRQVIAPGGTEWWHVHAEDSTSGLVIIADLFVGHPFHPKYSEDFQRFLNKPTRRAPTDPRDYTAVSHAIDRRGTVVEGIDGRPVRSAFAASTETLDVRIDHMHLTTAGESSVRLTCERGCLGPSVGFDLTLKPRFVIPQFEQFVPTLGRAGTFLTWVGGCPCFDVEGEIYTPDQAGETLVSPFAGRGYHDYVFGAGLLHPGIERWTRRRVLLDNRTLIYHRLDQSVSATPIIEVSVEATPSGWRPLAAEVWTAIVPIDEPTKLTTLSRVRRSISNVRVNGSIGRELYEQS